MATQRAPNEDEMLERAGWSARLALVIAIAWAIAAYRNGGAWPILLAAVPPTALLLGSDAARLGQLRLRHLGPVPSTMFPVQPAAAEAEELRAAASTMRHFRLQAPHLFERNVVLLAFIHSLLALQFKSPFDPLALGLGVSLACMMARAATNSSKTVLDADRAYTAIAARVPDEPRQSPISLLTPLVLAACGVIVLTVLIIVSTVT